MISLAKGLAIEGLLNLTHLHVLYIIDSLSFMCRSINITMDKPERRRVESGFASELLVTPVRDTGDFRIHMSFSAKR